MKELWQPDASAAGSKAAFIAHGKGGKLDFWQPSPSSNSNSAAMLAMRNKTLSPQIDGIPTADSKNRALQAATMSARQGRQRAESTPVPMLPAYPDSRNSGTNALNAATVSHRASVRSPDGWNSEANQAPRIKNLGDHMDRSMFGEHPPVEIEVEEARHNAALRASAVSMAKQMYDYQSRQSQSLDHGDGNAGAEAAAARSRESGSQDLKQEAVRYIHLQDAAHKLAAERLAKVDKSFENQRYRDYYYGTDDKSKRVSSRRSFRGRGRKRSSSEGQDNLDDSDDEEQARRIRTQMSALHSGVGDVDAKKQKDDRAKVMAAAEKRVSAQMHDMDQKVFRETGKVSTATMDEWEAKARKRQQEERELQGQNVGKTHIGGGKFMSRAEIEAIAAARLKPTLDEISDTAQRRRDRDEELRVQRQELELSQYNEKARLKEEKEESKRARSKFRLPFETMSTDDRTDEEKAAARRQKEDEKAASRKWKEDSKAIRDEEKRQAQEEKRKAEEEKRAAEEEKRKSREEEKRKAEEERRAAEEEKRKNEEAKKEEEKEAAATLAVGATLGEVAEKVKSDKEREEEEQKRAAEEKKRAAEEEEKRKHRETEEEEKRKNREAEEELEKEVAAAVAAGAVLEEVAQKVKQDKEQEEEEEERRKNREAEQSTETAFPGGATLGQGTLIIKANQERDDARAAEIEERRKSYEAKRQAEDTADVAFPGGATLGQGTLIIKSKQDEEEEQEKRVAEAEEMRKSREAREQSENDTDPAFAGGATLGQGTLIVKSKQEEEDAGAAEVEERRKSYEARKQEEGTADTAFTGGATPGQGTLIIKQDQDQDENENENGTAAAGIPRRRSTLGRLRDKLRREKRREDEPEREQQPKSANSTAIAAGAVAGATTGAVLVADEQHTSEPKPQEHVTPVVAEAHDQKDVTASPISPLVSSEEAGPIATAPANRDLKYVLGLPRASSTDAPFTKDDEDDDDLVHVQPESVASPTIVYNRETFQGTAAAVTAAATATAVAAPATLSDKVQEQSSRPVFEQQPSLSGYNADVMPTLGDTEKPDVERHISQIPEDDPFEFSEPTSPQPEQPTRPTFEQHPSLSGYNNDTIHTLGSDMKPDLERHISRIPEYDNDDEDEDEDLYAGKAEENQREEILREERLRQERLQEEQPREEKLQEDQAQEVAQSSDDKDDLGLLGLTPKRSGNELSAPREPSPAREPVQPPVPANEEAEKTLSSQPEASAINTAEPVSPVVVQRAESRELHAGKTTSPGVSTAATEYLGQTKHDQEEETGQDSKGFRGLFSRMKHRQSKPENKADSKVVTSESTTTSQISKVVDPKRNIVISSAHEDTSATADEKQVVSPVSPISPIDTGASATRDETDADAVEPVSPSSFKRHEVEAEDPDDASSSGADEEDIKRGRRGGRLARKLGFGKGKRNVLHKDPPASVVQETEPRHSEAISTTEDEQFEEAQDHFDENTLAPPPKVSSEEKTESPARSTRFQEEL